MKAVSLGAVAAIILLAGMYVIFTQFSISSMGSADMGVTINDTAINDTYQHSKTTATTITGWNQFIMYLLGLLAIIAILLYVAAKFR